MFFSLGAGLGRRSGPILLPLGAGAAVARRPGHLVRRQSRRQVGRGCTRARGSHGCNSWDNGGGGRDVASVAARLALLRCRGEGRCADLGGLSKSYLNIIIYFVVFFFFIYIGSVNSGICVAESGY